MTQQNSISSTESNYLTTFLNLIPEYCVNEDGKLRGVPEEWQANVVSYSFYLGLCIGQLDKPLASRLISAMGDGIITTADLVLTGLDEVEKTTHNNIGELWRHAINFIGNFMSLTSSETVGENADQDLVRRRAPICGMVPALRIAQSNIDFAQDLYRDAVDERERCCEEELIARIEWMKDFVDEVIRPL